MNKADIKDRIKEAMELREINQTELSKKANIDKGQLSSYIAGKYKPRQNNIEALSIALNVNEAWLMGFDVPMEREAESKWKQLKESIDKMDAFETQLKAMGWSCEYFYCNDWELIENAGMGINKNGEMVDGETGYPIGCTLSSQGYTKCGDCVYRHPHYKFSNDTLSFDVSPEEYISFRNDVEMFYKKRLQKLLFKSSMQIFDSKHEVIAAHERTDIEVTDKMKKHDDDIMNNSSEWE